VNDVGLCFGALDRFYAITRGQMLADVFETGSSDEDASPANSRVAFIKPANSRIALVWRRVSNSFRAKSLMGKE
jgi:hypothetical protein